MTLNNVLENAEIHKEKYPTFNIGRFMNWVKYHQEPLDGCDIAKLNNKRRIEEKIKFEELKKIRTAERIERKITRKKRKKSVWDCH